MTFDEWFALKGYKEEHRLIMQTGWEGAIRHYAVGLERRINVPRAGDCWIVRVKGGRIETHIYVERVAGDEIWICDTPGNKPPRHGARYCSNMRKRCTEELEFLQLVSRGK